MNPKKNPRKEGSWTKRDNIKLFREAVSNIQAALLIAKLRWLRMALKEEEGSPRENFGRDIVPTEKKIRELRNVHFLEQSIMLEMASS